MNIKDDSQMKGHVIIEQLRNGKWEFVCENHNVITTGLKYAVAKMIEDGSSVIANKMSAGTDNTSFTENSVALGNEVSSTISLANTNTQKITTCVATIVFSSNYTIQEVGLWYNTTALALTNVAATSVTPLAPIRISWQITQI